MQTHQTARDWQQHLGRTCSGICPVCQTSFLGSVLCCKTWSWELPCKKGWNGNILEIKHLKCSWYLNVFATCLSPNCSCCMFFVVQRKYIESWFRLYLELAYRRFLVWISKVGWNLFKHHFRLVRFLFRSAFSSTLAEGWCRFIQAWPQICLGLCWDAHIFVLSTLMVSIGWDFDVILLLRTLRVALRCHGADVLITS